jgi:hypothetical protein
MRTVFIQVMYSLFWSDVNNIWIFSRDFRKKYTQTKNAIKIRPVGAKLFHANGWTDMTKSIVASRNFANAPQTANNDFGQF